MTRIEAVDCHWPAGWSATKYEPRVSSIDVMPTALATAAGEDAFLVDPTPKEPNAHPVNISGSFFVLWRK